MSEATTEAIRASFSLCWHDYNEVLVKTPVKYHLKYMVRSDIGAKPID